MATRQPHHLYANGVSPRHFKKAALESESRIDVPGSKEADHVPNFSHDY